MTHGDRLLGVVVTKWSCDVQFKPNLSCGNGYVDRQVAATTSWILLVVPHGWTPPLWEGRSPYNEKN